VQLRSDWNSPSVGAAIYLPAGVSLPSAWWPDEDRTLWMNAPESGIESGIGPEGPGESAVEGVESGPSGGPGEGPQGVDEGPGPERGPDEGPQGVDEGPGPEKGPDEGPQGVDEGPGPERGPDEGPGGFDNRYEIPASWDQAKKLSSLIKTKFSTPPEQPTNNLDDIYVAAKEARPLLAEVAQRVVNAVGGQVYMRKNLKSRERAEEKITKECKGKAEFIADITAATVSFEDVQSAYAALVKLVNGESLPEGVKLVYVDDRFVTPVPSGFRDILTNIRIKDKHVAELRLGVETIRLAGEEEHKGYEKYRKWDKESYNEKQLAELQKYYDEWTPIFEDLFDKANHRWG
jgi:hypothetical protein